MERKRVANWVRARRLLRTTFAQWRSRARMVPVPSTPAAAPAAPARHVRFQSPPAGSPLGPPAALLPPPPLVLGVGDVAAGVLSDDSMQLLRTWIDAPAHEITRFVVGGSDDKDDEHDDDDHDHHSGSGGRATGRMPATLASLATATPTMSVASSGDLRLADLSAQRAAYPQDTWTAQVARRCVQLWRAWAHEHRARRDVVVGQWMEAAYYWEGARRRTAWRRWQMALAHRRRPQHEQAPRPLASVPAPAVVSSQRIVAAAFRQWWARYGVWAHPPPHIREVD
jgi:hypothetical protein